MVLFSTSNVSTPAFGLIGISWVRPFRLASKSIARKGKLPCHAVLKKARPVWESICRRPAYEGQSWVRISKEPSVELGLMRATSSCWYHISSVGIVVARMAVPSGRNRGCEKVRDSSPAILRMFEPSAFMR